MAKRLNVRWVFGIISLGVLCVVLVGWPYHLLQQNKRNDALIKAIQSHDPPAVQALLAQGADANAKMRLGKPPTFAEFCSQMLGGRQRRPEWGPAALMLAAHWERLPMVKMLVDAGADVNARDENGFTPLLFAAYNVKEDCGPIIRLLVAHGADVNATAKDGETVWQLAEMYPEIMNALPSRDK
ncbi:MAG: ankyrin repeat protein kinase family protein [Chthonomonadaceae bacterium]|nr:ankyrin repeat protein kinase family protein [Chthonomonadaceae bacterium]